MDNYKSKLLNGGLDMKITKIEKYGLNNEEYIEKALSLGMMNDYLFERAFFKVYISDVEPIDYLYRIMYEDVYLRRDYVRSSIPDENNNMVMFLSVSEAISFIKAALPPVFKPREKEAICSIDAIIETLLALLEEGQKQFEYMSLFRKYTGFNYFETKTNYSFERMKLIRQFNPVRPVVDIMVSTKSFDDLYDGIMGDEGSLYRPTGCTLHLMFNCIRKSELNIVYDILRQGTLNDNCVVKILNISHVEFAGYYVELYVENYDSEICKTINDIYKITYKPILNK